MKSEINQNSKIQNRNSASTTPPLHHSIAPFGNGGIGFKVHSSTFEVQSSSSPEDAHTQFQPPIAIAAGEALPLPGERAGLSSEVLLTKEEVRGNGGNDFKVQSSTFDVQSSSSSDDTESFSRLAQLSPAQYDRSRRAEAKRLHLRIETLDAEVAAIRSQLPQTPLTHSLTHLLTHCPRPLLPHSPNLPRQSGATAGPSLLSPTPWPSPVSGPEALDQVSSRYSLYLVLPPGAADAMSLWTAHAHAYAAFHLSPRLSLYSPKPGCGKTTAFDVLTTMVPRPLRTENISPAVLFRLVDLHQPTLLLDEVDAYLPQSEELRGLLNAGHKRGACAYRCEGEGKAVRAFRAFAPAALAGIGSLPATLRDRSVLVPLVAAEDGQITTRFDPLRTEIETTLARKLARWAADNFDALAACQPPLPPGAFNRLADNWRPLLAIAQIAGGDWPARALAAFSLLTAGVATAPRRSPSPRGEGRGEGEFSGSAITPTAHVPDSQALRLIADVRQIFTQSGRDRISSRDLAAALVASTNQNSKIENQNSPQPPHSLPAPHAPHAPPAPRSTPYAGLTPARLARLLAPLGVKPRVLRINGRCPRGYQLADFVQAFDQFLDDGPQSQRD